MPWLIAGLALIVIGIGSILLSSAFNGSHAARELGGDAPVDVAGAVNPLDINANNTPNLTVNPLNPANLVIANKIDAPNYSCALSVSFDGGGHWSQTPIPAPAGAPPKCYAPDASFGSDGTLYVSFATLAGRANAPDAAWLVSSRDGGATLSPPIRTPLGPDSFMVRVAADPHVAGRVYLIWVKAAPTLGLYSFGNAGNPIDVVRSDNGGRSWSSAANVSTAGRVVAPVPAFGPQGQLYVLYLNLEGDSLDYDGASAGRAGPPYSGRWELVLAKSTDRGASWTQSDVSTIVPTRRFIVYTPPFPSLTVDPGTGRLYVAFEDALYGHPDVFLWTLAPGASHWTGPIRVTNTPVHQDTWQYLPKVAVAPGGRVDIVYYDRRADPTNVLNQVSFQYSYDHGSTFSRRIILSSRPFSSRIGFGSDRGLADLGGTLALASTPRRALAAWTDTRAGTVLSMKQDITRAVVIFNDPARISTGLKTLLRVAGALLVLLGIVVIVLLGREGPRSPARGA